MRKLLPGTYLVLMTCLCAAPAARAGVIVPKNSEPGGGPAISLRRQHIAVTVRDQVARVTVDEQFESTADVPMEGTYSLPLPEGAAISGFATWIDGQRVDARIEEKAKAQSDYKAAQASGDAPAILEQDAHLFRTKVDSIPPHGTKRVEASYAQILPYDSGEVTLRIPLAQTGAAARDLELEVSVADQKKIASWRALPGSGALSGAGAFHAEKDGFSFHLAVGGAAPEDVALAYRTESSRLGLSFLPYRPEGSEDDGYFLLLASPQELTSNQDIVHKDVVFVFDTSGSMAAEHKIEQARHALERCLRSLGPEDRFGVVAFSDQVNPYNKALLSASAEHVGDAVSFAERLGAGGGTDIDAAMLRALSMLDDPSRPHVVVFFTDGVATSGRTDPELIADDVKEHAASARVFTFGVGSDVNRALLERLGTRNRGAFAMVEPGQDIDSVVGGFYAKIARPVLSDLALDFGAITTAMQYPDVMPDLYKGSQLVLVGRYRGHGDAAATLTGTLNGAKQSIPFHAAFPERNADNAFVARLWAQKRIDYLLSQMRLNGEQSEAKSEVIALSTRYQIVTPYTSMIATRPQPAGVAMVYPARVRPGDPEVSVRAPADSRSVRVRLPWGEAKQARWEPGRGVWTARFLVPADAKDGSYPIEVEIVARGGEARKIALAISVDTHAPALLASAEPVRAGGVLHLRAQAAISPIELLEALFTRGDRAEAAKALFDVRRATAQLWDGREVELKLGDGIGFNADVETSRALAPGRYPVTIVARDFAGNSSRTSALVEVRP